MTWINKNKFYFEEFQIIRINVKLSEPPSFDLLNFFVKLFLSNFSSHL